MITSQYFISLKHGFKKVWTLFGVLLFLLTTGCEKDIKIELNGVENLLVVDASIENSKAPMVYLSKSLGYFNSVSLSMVAKSFVHNAQITISDGTKSVLLKEYLVPFGTDTISYYSTDATVPAQTMVGNLNTTYNMSIVTDGKTYTSKTTIPIIAKTLDSLWWKVAPNNADTNRRIIFAKITDPPGLGNYIRYYTNVNDSAFLPAFNSVFNDDIVDGTTYNAQVQRGAINRTRDVDQQDKGFYRKGDSVEVKMCNIDKATFDFWRTLEFSQQSVGNPFSQPGVVLSNISGGALGYFGGYAAQYKKIIIRN